MFKNRQIKKKYLALVEGHPDLKGSVTFLIGRDPVHRHKMTHTNPHGRSAETHFEVVQYFTDKALLAVAIITGRTHQIRVHMTALGHPIVGDATYGKDSSLIARQALHAYQCSFEYQGTVYSFEAPLADDIKKVLEQLKPLI
jgi:23S rRNA pseudouridine1911/1915/1917 synthase